MSYGKWHRTPSSRTVCAILDRSSRMSRVIGALYRLLYDGVLCRLPEPTAVALGQTALRLLPWDRLAVFRLDDPRLAVTLGGVRLPNPLILAAMYYDPRIIMRAMGLGFGAVTTKSITVEPRPGHPQPNLARVRTPGGARGGDPHRQLRPHTSGGGPAPFAGVGRALRARSLPLDAREPAPDARALRPGARDHRHRRRGLARQGAPAAPRGRNRRRLLHRIHHARPDSGARDPRAPPRRPLSGRRPNKKCAQLIHMSTAIHSRRNRTV